MGDVLEQPVRTVEVLTVVDEADDNDLVAKIELLEDGVIVQTDQPNTDNRRWETTC